MRLRTPRKLLSLVALAAGMTVATAAAAFAPTSTDLIAELNDSFSAHGSYAPQDSIRGGLLLETHRASPGALETVHRFVLRELDATASHDGGTHTVTVQCRQPLGGTARYACSERMGYGATTSRTVGFNRRRGAKRWAEIVNALAQDQRAERVQEARAAINTAFSGSLKLSFVEGDLCRPRLLTEGSGVRYKYNANNVEYHSVRQGGTDLFRIRCTNNRACITPGREANVSQAYIASVTSAQGAQLVEHMNVVREFCD